MYNKPISPRRLRQNVSVKEMMNAKGNENGKFMRKTVSVPNFTNVSILRITWRIIWLPLLTFTILTEQEGNVQGESKLW